MSNKTKNILLGVCDGIIIGNYMWCISAYFDGLWKINLITKEAYKVIDLPVKIKDITLPTCREVLSYKNKIVMITLNLTIIIYDIDLNQLSVFDIKKCEEYNQDIKLLGGALIFDEWLLFYPSMVNQCCAFLYKYNLEKDYIESIELSKDCNTDGYFIYENGHCLYEGKLYFSLSRLNTLVSYDIKSDVITKIKYDNYGIGVSNVSVINQKVYLIPNLNGPIIKIDLYTSSMTAIKDYPLGYERPDYRSCISTISDKNTIYLIPMSANMVLEVNDNTIIESSVLSKLTRKIMQNNEDSIYDAIFWKAKTQGHNLYLISPQANAFYIYDMDTKRISEFKIYVNGSLTMNWPDTTRETYYYSLEDFFYNLK